MRPGIRLLLLLSLSALAGAMVTKARWLDTGRGLDAVPTEADTITDAAQGNRRGDAPPPIHPGSGIRSADNLLVLSWQPAFCETRPGKIECQALNAGLLPHAETQLSLHGLWPQPRGREYCGVSAELRALDGTGRWDALPAPDLSAATREALAETMPGTASHLDRHEWIRHGTCFFGGDRGEEYFADTLRVTAAINNSAIGDFLAAHVGAEIETADLRALFEQVFGAGAGTAVQVHCKGDGGRVLVQEVRVALKGRITEDGDLGALLRDAGPVSPGCPRGMIDPAGLQ